MVNVYGPGLQLAGNLSCTWPLFAPRPKLTSATVALFGKSKPESCKASDQSGLDRSSH